MYAATYAYHISKAHAFVDGNKRVTAVCAEVFLLINRAILNMSDKELEKLYLNIADGTLTRDEVEEFFRTHLYVL
ncbi:MAG: type II toxin-antitoxin system death-on-curing family toxin [Acidobacteriota bacterium]|nr:type II toxin-antitoxin system death-on-curing family toxin [Acidobacteriota bacterium]